MLDFNQALAEPLTIGPAENPAFSMGPVVDEKARKSILDYVELAKKEGEVLVIRYEGVIGGPGMPATCGKVDVPARVPPWYAQHQSSGHE